MQGTLIITILTVRSSYLQNIEEQVAKGTPPDTVQWWIGPTGSRRIKTYAVDHDIHVYNLEGGGDLKSLALANDRENYGDVIQSQHVIEFDDVNDPDEVDAAFQTEGLEARLEIAPRQFAFWKPDDARYHTQSQPQ